MIIITVTITFIIITITITSDSGSSGFRPEEDYWLLFLRGAFPPDRRKTSNFLTRGLFLLDSLRETAVRPIHIARNPQTCSTDIYSPVRTPQHAVGIFSNSLSVTLTANSRSKNSQK